MSIKREDVLKVFQRDILSVGDVFNSDGAFSKMPAKIYQRPRRKSRRASGAYSTYIQEVMNPTRGCRALLTYV